MKIRAYASRTAGSNLEGLKAAGWGLLISAYGAHRDEGVDDIMLDPGTWSTAASGGWDERKFIDLLDKYGSKSAQTIAPDIVRGGRESLALSLSWLDRLLDIGRPVLLAAQDGLETSDLRPHLGGNVWLAVGGSTDWKWETASSWTRLASECGVPCHILRANSMRMVRFASSIGAASFDGSGPSKFGACLQRIDRARGPTTMTFPLDLPAPFKPKHQDYNPRKKKPT